MFFCNLCPRYYSTKNSLLKHKKCKHSIDNNSVPSLSNNNNSEFSLLTDESEKYCFYNNINDNVPMESDSLNVVEQDFELDRILNNEFVNNVSDDPLCFETNSSIKGLFYNLILKYFSNPDIPRKHTLSIIKDILDFVKNKNCSIDDLSKYLEECPQTEYKVISKLKETGIFLTAEDHIISKSTILVQDRHGSFEQTEVQYSAKVFPLKELFTLLFQKTKYLDDILEYRHYLLSSTSDALVNIIQTDLFKDVEENFKKCFKIKPDDVLLPLVIYADDFEPNNALGSRAGYKKIGGVYINIECVPDHFRAKLFNIFEAMFYHSEDRKQFKNERVFCRFINEINRLMDGILVKNRTIFIVATILKADNLGLHQMCDFNEGFNGDYICRSCKTSVKSDHFYTKLKKENILTIDDYNNIIESGHFENSSIKGDSIFNKIGNNFHVVKNTLADPMHDVLEGIAHYDLLLLLEIYVKHEKKFTIEYINAQMECFFFNSTNKPPLINVDCFKSNKIKMSASEMLTFIKYFPFFVSSKIDKNDKYFELFFLLRTIVAISFSKFSYKNETMIILKDCIERHNELYIELYNSFIKEKTRFPFKFHMLLHYPSIVDHAGPLGNLHTMRLEANHQPQKQAVTSSKNKINMLETIAKKNSFQLANFITNYDEITKKNVKAGKLKLISSDEQISIREKFGFHCMGFLYSTEYLLIDDIILRKDLCIKTDEFEKTCNFIKIKDIIMYNSNYYLCIQRLETLYFDNFYFSFAVKELEEYNLIAISDFKNFYYNSYMYIRDNVNYLCFTEYFYYDPDLE